MGLRSSDDEKHLKLELLRLADNIDEKYTKLHQDALKLAPVAEFYRSFLKFTLGGKMEKCVAVMQNLQFLVKNGNVTVFEWKKGYKPTSVEKNQVKIEASYPPTYLNTISVEHLFLTFLI